jgi:hypothetical protein
MFHKGQQKKEKEMLCQSMVLMFHKGQQKKRKGDVMPIHGVINTPSIFGETAPLISRQGNNVVNPLAFTIELVLHKSFSWAFQRYMLKFDISL